MTRATLSPADPRSATWWRPVARRVLPGAVLTAFLVYYWRINDLSARAPGYGDALEYLWSINWFLDGIRSGEGFRLFNPTAFMPEGWSLATFANGLGVFLLATPIAALTNTAAAFNTLVLSSFFIAFFGMYRLARYVAGPGIASLVALLYLLWGGRWIRIAGHLHILLGSALLPWIILFLERSISDRRRWLLWSVAAGITWAVAISFSLYFIWFGAFLCFGWLLGAALQRRITAGQALMRLIATGGLAALICAPYFYLYLEAEAGTVGFNIQHVNDYNLSPDWLPALYPHHAIPALADLANRQVNGAKNEAAFNGFGIILLGLAVLGIFARGQRPPQWRAILLTVVIGIILALGPTLLWRGEFVSWEPLRPLNELIWDLGHGLKPDIFPGEDAPADFTTAVPLPGLVLSVFVPFFEGARVPSRYLLIAAPGLLLLAAIGLKRLRKPSVIAVIALLLVVEAARVPVIGVPFPPPEHTAFTWLAGHPVAPGESVVDIYEPLPDVLIPAVGGEILWAGSIHKQPVIGGGGSVLPVHFNNLLEWFFQHPDPVGEAEFPWLMRSYGVRYLLLHMRDEPGESLARLAAGSAELTPIDCFEPAPGALWQYPICIVELAPADTPFPDLLPIENFSAMEEWGVWALGTSAQLDWISTSGAEARFAVEAFPYCVDDMRQAIELVAGEHVLATHEWNSCDPWQAEIVVPSDLVEIGRNSISLRMATATRPVDQTNGQNPDPRELSVGFTRFERIP